MNNDYVRIKKNIMESSENKNIQNVRNKSK